MWNLEKFNEFLEEVKFGSNMDEIYRKHGMLE